MSRITQSTPPPRGRPIEPRKLEPTDVWQAHQGRCLAGLFSRDGKKGFTVGHHGLLKQWNLTENDLYQLLSPSESSEDRDFSISRDGNMLAVVGNPTLRLYRKEGNHFALIDTAVDKSFRSVDFLANGEKIITGRLHGDVQLWETASLSRGSIEKRHVEPSQEIKEVVVSPDGGSYVICLGPGSVDRIRLFDVKTGARIPHFQIDSGMSVCFSPDGKLLAFGSQDDVVLWELSGDRREFHLKAHSNTVHSVRFHPNGSMLASGGYDRNIVLWDLESHKPTKTLVGQESRIYCLAFSPNGLSLVSSGSADAAKVWHVQTGQLIGDLFPGGHEKIIFSDDSQLLIGLRKGAHPIVRDLTAR